MGARAQTRIGRRAAALLALAAALSPRPARADDAQTLELGKNRFDAGQYEEAAKRFAAMLDPVAPACDKGSTQTTCRLVDPDLVESARALYAASLLALKHPDEANVQIEKVLRQHHAYRPSPAMFPQEVIDRFTEVRTRLAPEFEAEARAQAERDQAQKIAQQKWIDELKRLAGTEKVVQVNSRAIALLPFGVGQFQNGDTALGVFFAVSEALAGGTAIAAGALESYYTGLDPTSNPVALTSRVDTSATVNRIAFGAWAGLTLAGIIQAQVGFVPERSFTRPRPVPPPPPPPKVLPTVSFQPGGATVGLVGRF
jgi:hypothetical protein